MKEIQVLEDLISEEMENSNKYMDLAMEYKESCPEMAKAFYDLSVSGNGRKDTLHAQVVKKIEKYRQEHGEPPAPMMAVYDYLHKKEMAKAANLKIKQDMWRQY